MTWLMWNINIIDTTKYKIPFPTAVGQMLWVKKRLTYISLVVLNTDKLGLKAISPRSENIMKDTLEAWSSVRLWLKSQLFWEAHKHYKYAQKQT